MKYFKTLQKLIGLPNVINSVIITYISQDIDLYLTDIEEGKLELLKEQYSQWTEHKGYIKFEKNKELQFCYLNSQIKINTFNNKLHFFVDTSSSNYEFEFLILGNCFYPILYEEIGYNNENNYINYVYERIDFDFSDGKNNKIVINTETGHFINAKLNVNNNNTNSSTRMIYNQKFIKIILYFQRVMIKLLTKINFNSIFATEMLSLS